MNLSKYSFIRCSLNQAKLTYFRDISFVNLDYIFPLSSISLTYHGLVQKLGDFQTKSD